MTEVGEKETGASSRVVEVRPLWFALIVVLLSLPIFAHGCHRGDHDDEPAVLPAGRDMPNPELSLHPAP